MKRIARGGAALAAMLALGLLLMSCGGSSSSGGQTLQVTLTNEGCDPPSINASSGKTTFKVTNKDAGGVTEFEILDGNHVIGEVENVVPGLTRSFSIDLQTGTYTTYCPGGSKNEKGTLAVTGAASATATPSGPLTTVNVIEDDFSIAPSVASGPAGNFRFDITNNGPTTHEFVIVKTDLPAAQLPVQDNEVNEDDSRLQHIDELEDLTHGTNASFSVNLPAGHYAFICNLPGHYQLGMHIDFTVN